MAESADSKQVLTFFFYRVLLFALPEVVFGQEQHPADQICCRDSLGTTDLPENEKRGQARLEKGNKKIIYLYLFASFTIW